MHNSRFSPVAALGAGLCLLAGCGGPAGSGGPPPGRPAAEPSRAIIGSWRPADIPGYRPPPRYPDAFRDAPISFDTRQRMWGSDGCNGFEVSYHVGRDGSFSAGAGAMGDVGCANVPNGQVTGLARRVAVDRDVLTFFDGDGRVLGRYRRIPPVGRPDVGPGPLASALVGTWRPLAFRGYRVPPAYSGAMRYAAITFTSTGSWRASDGCTMTSGTYVLGDGGRIAVTAGPSTGTGCADVPNAAVLGRAATAQVVGDRLTLRSAGGVVLGTYQRVDRP